MKNLLNSLLMRDDSPEGTGSLW